MAKVETTGFTTTQTPAWAVDYFDRPYNLPGGARLHPADFAREGTFTVTVGAGGALAGALSIPVTALPGAVPAGTILDFTGPGEFALVTSDAAIGAVSLAVEALDAAIEAGDTATFQGSGKRYVPSGTCIGRTFAEAEANRGFGPAVATDEQIYLLLHTVIDADQNPDCELYRHGGAIKLNHLPGYAGLPAGVQQAIRDNYEITYGANVVGEGIV